MDVCMDRMERDTTSPRVTKGAMVGCGSVQETGIEMDVSDAIQSVRHIRCMTHTSESEPASPEEPLCPQVSRQSVTVMSVTSSKDPVSAAVSGGSSNSPANMEHLSHLSDASTSDMECLICCNQYSLGRLPKVLACSHVFCAACLKLILKHEDDSWRIMCPICRRATVVFGGLICSLHDQEDLLGHLDNSEVLFSSGTQTGPQLSPGTFYIHQEDDNTNNQVATKRLLFLLVLMVMIVLLALPFMYPGMLKITLCIAVILGLAMSGVLCFNPKWTFGCSDLSSQQKRANHITSIA